MNHRAIGPVEPLFSSLKHINLAHTDTTNSALNLNSSNSALDQYYTNLNLPRQILVTVLIPF